MGGDSNRPYNLTFSLNARNIFNNVNLANPVSVLTLSSLPGQPPVISPSFDTSISTAGGGFGGSSAANRLLYLQASFSF